MEWKTCYNSWNKKRDAPGVVITTVQQSNKKSKSSTQIIPCDNESLKENIHKKINSILAELNQNWASPINIKLIWDKPITDIQFKELKEKNIKLIEDKEIAEKRKQQQLILKNQEEIKKQISDYETKKKAEDQRRKTLAIEQDKKWASVELLSQESQETARKAAELERARILKKHLQIEEIVKTKASNITKQTTLEKEIQEEKVQAEKEALEKINKQQIETSINKQQIETSIKVEENSLENIRQERLRAERLIDNELRKK